MLDTYFNGQILSAKPKKTPTELPSSYQVGDDVDLFFGPTSFIQATVFSVKFGGDGAVSYDLAVQISNSGFYAVCNNIRGSMRKSGSTDTPDHLVEFNKEFISDMKRRSFHVVE